MTSKGVFDASSANILREHVYMYNVREALCSSRYIIHIKLQDKRRPAEHIINAEVDCGRKKVKYPSEGLRGCCSANLSHDEEFELDQKKSFLMTPVSLE